MDVASRTYRLMGIGESQVAEILGDDLLRTPDPEVATYARAEAVDVRISAVGRPGRPAADAVETAGAIVVERLGAHIWATGDTTWSAAIGEALGRRGWTLAVIERETGGQVGALFGDVPWLRVVESVAGPPAAGDPALLADVRDRRKRSGADVGLGVHAADRGGDTDVAIAVVTPAGEHVEHRTAFLGGSNGRLRAALAAAAVLFLRIRDAD